MELLLIYPPCFDNPWFTYIGARDYEKQFSAEWTAFKARWSHKVTFLTYPCPELLYKGWPRIPNGREHYRGMDVEPIVDFLLKVIKELKPRKIVVIGKKYSPTCAIFNTTEGEARTSENVRREWEEASVEGRRKLKKKIWGLRVTEGKGIFIEKLLERLGNFDVLLLEAHPRSRRDIQRIEGVLSELFERFSDSSPDKGLKD